MTAAATPPAVHARAPGKINVFMKVGSLLDDGYHDVATAYQAISLYEEVFARDADDFSVRFRGPIDTADLPTDRRSGVGRLGRRRFWLQRFPRFDQSPAACAGGEHTLPGSDR